MTRLATFMLRYWKGVSFLLSIAGTVAAVLYGTVRKAEAHDLVLAAHEQKLIRLENMAAATYINAMLACSASGARGCITKDRLERGDVPQLQLATEPQ